MNNPNEAIAIRGERNNLLKHNPIGLNVVWRTKRSEPTITQENVSYLYKYIFEAIYMDF